MHLIRPDFRHIKFFHFEFLLYMIHLFFKIFILIFFGVIDFVFHNLIEILSCILYLNCDIIFMFLI